MNRGGIVVSNIEDAVERLKRLECPTGEVENRIAGILSDYGIGNGMEVSVKRDRSLDRNGAEAYLTDISKDCGKSIVVLAKSGLDDYVAKVEDVYIK